MDPGLIIAGMATVLTAAGLLAHWVLDRADTLADEMIKQDYHSLGTRLGDGLLWLAARRTFAPLEHFEEWFAHMRELRETTGKPCLPDAIWFFLRAPAVGPLGAAAPLLVAPPEPIDSEFVANVLDQIFTLWVEPELAVRGGEVDRDAVHRAVVVMAPGRPLEVRINDEAEWIAHIRAKRAIEAGEQVTTEDVDLDQISDLRPANVDANAAWTGFVTVGEHQLIAFDLRRNRAIAHAWLDEARSVLGEARKAMGRRRYSAVIKRLQAAASLTLRAQMHLHDDAPPDDPQELRRRFRHWTELGNAPRSHSLCVDRLALLGPKRLGLLSAVWLRRTEVDELCRLVDGMISWVQSAVGEPFAP